MISVNLTSTLRSFYLQNTRSYCKKINPSTNTIKVSTTATEKLKHIEFKNVESKEPFFHFFPLFNNKLAVFAVGMTIGKFFKSHDANEIRSLPYKQDKPADDLIDFVEERFDKFEESQLSKSNIQENDFDDIDEGE